MDHMESKREFLFEVVKLLASLDDLEDILTHLELVRLRPGPALKNNGFKPS